jgi:hypothetical protein
MPMKDKIIVFLTICFAISIQSVYAATIPAGTTLFVQTNETISSSDPVGKKFAAQLYRDVVANGKLLLRAGTGVVGRVDSSRGLGFTPVILNVTKLTIGQRLVPITTVEGFKRTTPVLRPAAEFRSAAVATFSFRLEHECSFVSPSRSISALGAERFL